jgi:hypothetical protein
LRRSFQQYVASHSDISCLLVHTSCRHKTPKIPQNVQDIRGASNARVYEPHEYGFSEDDHKPLAMRQVILRGPSASIDDFFRFAADAGRALIFPPSQLTAHVATPTLLDSPFKWIYVVFDLAWKCPSGSPLWTPQTPWINYDKQKPLPDWVSRQFERDGLPRRDSIREFQPTDRHFFHSEIHRLFDFSVYAIDRCFHILEGPAQATENATGDLSRRPSIDAGNLSGSRIPAGAGESAVENEQKGPVYEFRQVGNIWRLRFDREEGDYSGQIGFHYFVQLLSQPGRRFTALELMQVDERKVSNVPAQKAFDETTRKETQEAIEGTSVLLDDARKAGKIDMVEKYEEDLKQLKEYSDGASRRPLNKNTRPQEKARKAVTQALTRARDAIARSNNMPKLVKHLKEFVRPGGNCDWHYTPSDRPDWKTY